jgi:hypothetical protein
MRSLHTAKVIDPSRNRLDVKVCRQFLDPACALDDPALCKLRDELYLLASVALSFLAGDASRPVESLSEGERADVEERAAILQFEGRLPREPAEQLPLMRIKQNRRQ